jgi:hypothetical protein
VSLEIIRLSEISNSTKTSIECFLLLVEAKRNQQQKPSKVKKVEWVTIWGTEDEGKRGREEEE